MFARRRHGAVDIIVGDDPLDRNHVKEVLPILDQSISTGQPRIVVDLTSIPLIDSAGLELLLDAHDRCARRGGMVHLAAINPLCRDILTATGLASEFEIFGEVHDAVGSFAQ